jgi:hypothetical protein
VGGGQGASASTKRNKARTHAYAPGRYRLSGADAEHACHLMVRDAPRLLAERDGADVQLLDVIDRADREALRRVRLVRGEGRGVSD